MTITKNNKQQKYNNYNDRKYESNNKTKRKTHKI